MGYRATLIDDRAEFVMREISLIREIELVAAVELGRGGNRSGWQRDTESVWQIVTR